LALDQQDDLIENLLEICAARDALEDDALTDIDVDGRNPEPRGRAMILPREIG
jgi:hypothetical protein